MNEQFLTPAALLAQTLLRETPAHQLTEAALQSAFVAAYRVVEKTDQQVRRENGLQGVAAPAAAPLAVDLRQAL